MKIVNLCASDTEGGASIAARRLHETMLNHGLNSSLLVSRKNTLNVPNVTSCVSKNSSLKKLFPKIDNFPTKFYKKGKEPWGNAFLGQLDVSHPILKDADVILVYWMDSGFMSLSFLNWLLKKKNSITLIRLSDQWMFTGGCHYTGTCNKYTTQCGSCRILNSNSKKDLSFLNFKRKLSINFDSQLILSPSAWVGEAAKKSRILGAANINVIGTGVDLDIFTPRRTEQNVSELSTITFGAFNFSTDRRKGWEELLRALFIYSNTNKKTKSKINIFGEGSAATKSLEQHYEVNYLGHINDEKKLANVYANSDVFICPSLQENLPNTAIEAIACGTPVVCFDIGGLKEIVKHKITGYCSQELTAVGLAEGIKYILEDKKRYNLIRQNCIKFAQDNLSNDLVLTKILKIVKEH